MPIKTLCGISDAGLARLSGCSTQVVNDFRNRLTSIPVGQWSPQQALGFAAYCKARKLGASRAGALNLWGALEHADLQQIRDSIDAGCTYLRVVDDECENRLVSAAVAFDATTLATLALHGTPNVTIDVGVLLEKIDELTEEKK